jgi:hypothetical protein
VSATVQFCVSATVQFCVSATVQFCVSASTETTRQRNLNTVGFLSQHKAEILGTNSDQSDNHHSLSDLIDARIRQLDDSRCEMLSRLRASIKAADPEGIEEWKWRGVQVWYHEGMICTGETYKNVVKITLRRMRH